MAEYVICNKEDLVAIADAIREKNNKTDNLTLDEIKNEVNNSVDDSLLLCSILNGTCENLVSDTITDIGDYVFYNCTSLKTIDLPNCINIGESTFICGVYDDYDNRISPILNVNLPNIIKIGEEAFSNQTKMSFSDGSLAKCTNIGKRSFEYCKNITNLYLPELTEIGDYAFNYAGIEQIYAPKITYLPSGAFSCDNTLKEWDFTNLKECESNSFEHAFSSEITEITSNMFPSLERGGFSYCSDIKKISLNIQQLVGWAFNYCVNLEEINLPNISIIPSYAFSNCKKLTKINTQPITSIGNSAFIGCPLSDDMDLTKCSVIDSNGLQYSTSTLGGNMTKIYLPQVTSIGNRAFRCRNLRKIFIGANCTTINASSYSYSPFYGCTNAELKIFCEIAEKPEGWETYWNYISNNVQAEVVWNATYEDYEAY